MMFSVILLSMVMILLSTLKLDQVSDLQQQLELASELECDLWDTLDWSRKWLFESARKTQLVSFDLSNNTGAYKTPILLNWIGVLTLPLMLNMLPRELVPWFVLWSFFLLKLLCFPINLPYGPAWNTFCHVCVGASSCYLEFLDKLKNGYAGLLVLLLLPLLNLWRTVEM